LWAFLDAAAVIVCCQQRTNQWDFSHYYVSSDAARSSWPASCPIELCV
jgi:hypothetical protein